MNDIVFFGVTLTYFWFGAKVDEWITIAALGFKFETPSLFLQRPRNYDVFRVVLFLAACVGSMPFRVELDNIKGIGVSGRPLAASRVAGG